MLNFLYLLKLSSSCWKMAIKNMQIQLFGACSTCIYDSNIFSESSCKASAWALSDHILSGIRLSVSLSVRLWTFNILYFSRTTRPTSTKLGTKHPCGKKIKAKNVLNSSLGHTSDMYSIDPTLVKNHLQNYCVDFHQS